MPADAELLAELDWVRALAARLVFDASDRADLEQEIWRAALHRPRDGGVPLRAWLTGVGRHLAALLHRGTARRRRREQLVARDLVLGDPAELAAAAERQQLVLAAVNTLPPEQRTVVLLRFMQGLPPRAIARQLAVPVATVRTRLARALARLRDQLDHTCGDRRTWALALLSLPRPQHVVAAAGLTTTTLQLGLVLMQTHKVLTAAAVLLLAAIPTTLALAGGGPPVPPDYHRSEPVTALWSGRATVPPPDTATERTAAALARTLRGRVVDAHGEPIAGAVVHKQPAWAFADRVAEGRLAAHDATTTTAADGTFTLSDVGANAQGLTVTATHAEHVAEQESVPCRFGEPATIVLLRVHEVPFVVDVFERTTRVRPPRFLVHGTVHLGARNGGTITLPTHQLQHPDGAEGRDGRWQGTARFVVGHDYDVLMQCAGHGRAWLWQPDDPVPRRTVRPEPGVPLHLVFEVDFDQLERAGGLVQHGRVVDAATMAPLAGIELGAVSGGASNERNWRCVQTRADGTFALALPPDASCRLRCEHPAWQTEERAFAPGEDLVVALRPRASLTVQLVDEAAGPIAGACVLVASRRNERFRHRARTDATGTLRLTGLLAGDYTVYVLPFAKAADEQALTSARWQVAAGEVLEVTMPIQPPDAVHVRGTVFGGDATTTPVFVPLDGNRGYVEARRQGALYDAGGLAPGDHLVGFLGRSGCDRLSLGPVVTVRGLGIQTLDLTVPTATVRARLTGTLGADWRVVAVPTGLRGLARELVDSEKSTRQLGVAPAADGSFTLADLPEAELELQLRDTTKVLARRTIRVQGTTDLGDWVIAR